MSEQQLFIAREDLALSNAFVSGVRPFQNLYGHYHQVFLVCIRQLQGFADMIERVVVTSKTQRVAGADSEAFTGHVFFRVGLELIHLDMCCRALLSFVDALGNYKNEEKDQREGHSGDRRHLFGEQVYSGYRKQQRCDHSKSNRNLIAAQMDIEGHLPLALRIVFESQHNHRQSLEGKRPDDAEGVSLSQNVDIAARADNRRKLQEHDQVDHAVGGAVFLMRFAEPICKHAVFRHAVQDAVGSDNRCIDCAGQHEEADDDDKRLEQES